jgi:hypothetical protein
MYHDGFVFLHEYVSSLSFSLVCVCESRTVLCLTFFLHDYSIYITYNIPYNRKIYVVDIDEVPDFNSMYELYDPCTTMFFYRNRHIMVDLGTGDNNKINWALSDKQEMIDIIEVVYRGARKGRGLVVAPKDYSTKYRY